MTGVVVVSPHLDDAIMSIGGLIIRMARAGQLVRILTVFAGLPTLAGPPSAWDAQRGLARAADAFAARAAEDVGATARLGVEGFRLPFLDNGYGVERDSEAIWAAMEPHLADADLVLIPGVPLAHADHRFVTELTAARLGDPARLGIYAEQPYCLRPRYLRSFLARSTPPELLLQRTPEAWTDIRLSSSERRAKAQATACYAGELRALGWRRHMDSVMGRLLPSERVALADGVPVPKYLAVAR